MKHFEPEIFDDSAYTNK